MKNLRNFLRAILWVWSAAGLIFMIVTAVRLDTTWLLWMIGFLVLSIITWFVYVGLNGDLDNV